MLENILEMDRTHDNQGQTVKSTSTKSRCFQVGLAYIIACIIGFSGLQYVCMPFICSIIPWQALCVSQAYSCKEVKDVVKELGRDGDKSGLDVMWFCKKKNSKEKDAMKIKSA